MMPTTHQDALKLREVKLLAIQRIFLFVGHGIDNVLPVEFLHVLHQNRTCNTHTFGQALGRATASLVRYD